MATSASKHGGYVIERLSARGLLWLQRIGDHGPIWSKDKNKAQRFLGASDATAIMLTLLSSVADQLHITLIELSDR
jgi:hypothetical protein